MSDQEEFQVGDKVSIIRTRHGWFDGNLEGVVESRWLRSNAQRYSYNVKDSDGYIHEVKHRKDLRKIG